MAGIGKGLKQRGGNCGRSGFQCLHEFFFLLGIANPEFRQRYADPGRDFAARRQDGNSEAVAVLDGFFAIGGKPLLAAGVEFPLELRAVRDGVFRETCLLYTSIPFAPPISMAWWNWRMLWTFRCTWVSF